MNKPGYVRRIAVCAKSRPALRPHMKLRHDTARNRWVVLAPERILALNAQAADALRLCNGDRAISEIAALLAENYDAAPTAIEADILSLLQDLADGGVVQP